MYYNLLLSTWNICLKNKWGWLSIFRVCFLSQTIRRESSIFIVQTYLIVCLIIKRRLFLFFYKRHFCVQDRFFRWIGRCQERTWAGTFSLTAVDSDPTSNTVQKTLAGSIQTRTETYYAGNAKWNNRAFQTARPSPVFVGFDYILCMFYILYISIYKNIFFDSNCYYYCGIYYYIKGVPLLSDEVWRRIAETRISLKYLIYLTDESIDRSSVLFSIANWPDLRESRMPIRILLKICFT